jgi:hypothetical protein
MANPLRRCVRVYLPALLLLWGLPAAVWANDGDPVTLVGMHGHLDGVILPGPELEVKPLEDSQVPFVVRIANVYPRGSAFGYDFVYYGLEPRTYDLSQYLRAKDGSAVKLPPLQVVVKGLLGPGLVRPHALEPKHASWFAGYHLFLVVGMILWVLGLALILLWGRRRRLAAVESQTTPKSAAERLRPLVARAMTGVLPPAQIAELERTLLAFWRQRLGLEGDNAPEALAKLRAHPEAGALLRQMELWLHRPGTANQVEVGQLLGPYQVDHIKETAAPAPSGGPV